jgi:hypothetical protein
VDIGYIVVAREASFAYAYLPCKNTQFRAFSKSARGFSWGSLLFRIYLFCSRFVPLFLNPS